MKAELYLILERFPELKELILSRFEGDEEFQALCLEYFFCLKSLDSRETDMKKSKERYEEYVVLKRGIENKMLQHITRDNYSAVDPYRDELSGKNN
jgi:hypothetical protein